MHALLIPIVTILQLTLFVAFSSSLVSSSCAIQLRSEGEGD